jgi:copper(I)-binding protein
VTRLTRCWLACVVLLPACSADPGAPLTASEVTIFAPLPGQTAAVAYLSLRNESDEPIVLTLVSSPDFATVEMHATVIDRGIAEMLSVDSISIAERSAVDFSTGGKHLMLMYPTRAFAPRDDVTLEFHYGSDGLLTLTAPLRARASGDVR